MTKHYKVFSFILKFVIETLVNGFFYIQSLLNMTEYSMIFQGEVGVGDVREVGAHRVNIFLKTFPKLVGLEKLSTLEST